MSNNSLLKSLGRLPIPWDDAENRDGDAEVSRLSRTPQNQVVETGPELVDEIVRAIELNQSVLLSGPRGCGKSFCIKSAVREAQRRGILAIGSDLTCQGNREVARDYLLEDDTVFRKNRETHKIDPEIRSAPLFEFAVRGDDGEPLADPESREVSCITRHGSLTKQIRRFSLFLDEINRFSDGVLDGLLSVLEEKEAYLRGKKYKLPVVVLMTMNPPGYDATARSLSPPLAARISRCYQLSTPGIDTLSDLIIAEKIDGIESRYSGQLSVPAILRRRAALASLLLWGHPSPADGLPRLGMEYLTHSTLELLKRCLNLANDKGLVDSEGNAFHAHLTTLSELCRFGPDGRAASDWLTSASARALREGEGTGKVVVKASHCKSVAIESLSHKIYDDFSPASEPDKVRRKDKAVFGVCEVVMGGHFDQLIKRDVDDDAAFAQQFAKVVDQNEHPETKKRLQKAFVRAGVTQNTEGFIRKLIEGCHNEDAFGTAVAELEFDHLPVFTPEKADWPNCFSSRKLEQLFVDLGRLSGPLPAACQKLVKCVLRPRLPYKAILSKSQPIIRGEITMDSVTRELEQHKLLSHSELFRVVLDFFLSFSNDVTPETITEFVKNVFVDLEEPQRLEAMRVSGFFLETLRGGRNAEPGIRDAISQLRSPVN